MIQVGKPVTGRSFVGREKEVQDLINYIKMGQSVVLIAPRRFGKTSLVMEVLKRLRSDKCYVAMLDLFEFNTISQLSRSIIAEVIDNHGLKKAYIQTRGSVMAMLKHIKLKAVIDDFEFLLGMEDPTIDDWTNFSNSISFIDDFAQQHGKQICFAFDEYGDILKFDSNQSIIKLMRSKVQSQTHASYIFSGSYESVMESLFVSDKSPFYRLAKIITLGYLPFEAVRSYMIRELTDWGITPDMHLIEDNIDFFKGHPYYCSLSLQQIYLYHLTHHRLPTFEELLEYIVDNERHYLQQLWASLSTNKEYVQTLLHLSRSSTGLYTMAKKHNINASRALKMLIGRGIIYQEGKEYHYYDPVFQYWVANTMKG